MNPLAIVQALTALVSLMGQITPLLSELKAAFETQDDAKIEDLLKRLQAVNDQLGSA